MSKKSIQDVKTEEIIKWQDVCTRSYDGRHIWAQGELTTPVTLLGFVLPISRVGLKLNICRACGTIKRKE